MGGTAFPVGSLNRRGYIALRGRWCRLRRRAQTKAEIHTRSVLETLADAPRGRLGEVTQGERGIRAQHTAARAKAQRAESQDEAVRNRMTAALAEMDSGNCLKVPEDSVRASGEMMSPDFMRSCPSCYLIDTLQNPSMVSVIASEYRVDLAAYIDSRVAELAVDTAQSAQAANSAEKMLCHQMAAAHRAAMKMLGQSVRVSNYPVEVARLSNAAARMVRVFQEGF